MVTCVRFSRSLPSNSWWQTMAGWQALSRPSAAEGGGRRPAFTGLATQPYSATEVDGWQHKLGRVSQNRAAVQRTDPTRPRRSRGVEQSLLGARDHGRSRQCAQGLRPGAAASSPLRRRLRQSRLREPEARSRRQRHRRLWCGTVARSETSVLALWARHRQDAQGRCRRGKARHRRSQSHTGDDRRRICRLRDSMTLPRSGHADHSFSPVAYPQAAPLR